MKGRGESEVVVTATNRLARQLLTQWDHQQAVAGRMVWSTPWIFSWQGWLDRLWQELLDHGEAIPGGLPRLLTPYQEEWLWQQAIEEETDPATLLDVAALARQAMTAHALLSDWQRVPSPDDLLDHEDGRAFMGWRRKVLQRCADQRWLLAADRLLLLMRGVDFLPLPQSLRLAGFDKWTPLQQNWLALLQERGVVIQEDPPHPVANQCWRVEAADGLSEIHMVAQWSRHHLLNNPEQHIGVVVPRLHELKGEIERIFLQTFAGGQLLQGKTNSETFALSLGESFQGWPMSREALFLLSLHPEQPLTVGEYTSLLHSPFWRGSDEEFMARSQLQAWLRKKNLPWITLAQLAEMDGVPPQCRSTLQNLLPLLKEAAGQTLYPSVWAGRFHQWLKVWGWPGEQTLESHEMQLQMAWWELVGQLATLDDLLGVLSWQEAHHHLSAMAARKLFLPESKEAPVQIMGILEAAGVVMDHMWLLGFSDENWPLPLNVHPLLPAGWQRTMGSAAPARHQQVSQGQWQRLLSSANQIIISHGKREGDREIRLTPWAQEFHLYAGETFSKTTAWPRQDIPVQLESFLDWQAPAIPEGEQLSGGSGLFKSQAICPFQAFARYRLRVESLPEPQPVADLRQRGMLIHWVFEEFWQMVTSKERLLALTTDEIYHWTGRAAQAGVERYCQKFSHEMAPPMPEMEIARMQKMLLHWLELEFKREDDFQVMAREHKEALEIGGLTVDLRPDRLDQLAQGGLAVVDYKTSLPSRASWREERLSEPQLPLYGLLRRETVDVLAFAVARPGEMEFRGVGRQAGEWPGVTRLEQQEWHNLLDHWHQALTNIAEEFRQGVALAAPLNATACQQCDLARLCRIGSRNTGVGEEDESIEHP
ncbi:MAG: hypothetical protein G8345_15725 [Magnetococcales bacterium]|nr:hypothetical protein [Magnetococcales bacterium]